MKKILVMMIIGVIMLTGCAIKSPATDVIETVDITTIESLKNDEVILPEVEMDVSTETIFPETESEEILEETIQEETDILEPELPPIPTYKIIDMELGGRDITTYGDFPEEFVFNLESMLDAYPKNISLAVYSLDGSRAMVYNGNQQYFSACTVKIPWMLYLCQEIDAGRVDKDTVITYEEKHYHKGSGSIRKGSYGDTYTIEQLINLCLSISDNVAYEMLVQEVIDRNDFYEFLEQFEFDRFQIPSYSIWCSNAIPTDFLMIWEGVYEYFKTETTGSKILKTACTNTQWNYGTATLQDYDYSHKSGDNWEPNAAHNDAGIVWAETPYLYAIFTKSEGNDYDERNIDAVMGLVHEEFCK